MLKLLQSTTRKLMLLGGQNEHQDTQRSTFPFGNKKVQKGWVIRKRINKTVKSTYQSTWGVTVLALGYNCTRVFRSAE